MLKVILQAPRPLPPFNEPARDLRVQNKPLWLNQRDTLAPFVTRELELTPHAQLPDSPEPMIVYRDNLYFDNWYLRAFLGEAFQRKRAYRAAFSSSDPAFSEHALPLSTSYTSVGNLFLADLWYYPNGPVAEVEPLVIDLQAREIGYYHVPTYMAGERGDLVFQVPLRALIAIDSWVHLLMADIVFGLFARGARFEERLKKDVGYKLRILGKAIYEGKQILECSELVKVGKNCVIDPRAVIHGPTTIGDNVTIGAGAVLENCVIGSNVNISQGCQVMLSVVGDGTFLPFRGSLFMSTVMDNSMVAQNACLQLCVIGRNSFIGSGTTLTDYNLIPTPIHAMDGNDRLSVSNRPVLGSCVGHNCRLGSGLVIYPARMVESDVVLLALKDRYIVDKDIYYEESDHHHLEDGHFHQRLYPRRGERESISW